jgi:hypothetical protein
MAQPIIYRQGKMFKLNDELLPESAKNSMAKNSLYLSIYQEFAGAAYQDKYKGMTNEQKLQALCAYVENWLVERKYK